MNTLDPYLRPVKRFECGDVTLDAVHYAAGLTDADGCFNVQVRPQLVSLQFTMSQSLKGIEALIYLYDILGGSILLQLPGDAKNQRAYSWVLNGQDAFNYVALIAPHLLLKKREALRFLDFPTDNLHIIPIIAKHTKTATTLEFKTLKDCQTHFGKHLAFQKREQIYWQDWIIQKSLSKDEVDNIRSERLQIAKDLQKFKKETHDDIDASTKPNTAYLAGFFDGDGTIDTFGKFGQHHQVTQKSIAICNLYKRLFGGTVGKHDCGFAWNIYDGAAEFLEEMSPFIIGKKRQVDLVLSMKSGEGEKTHALLREMKGKGKMKTARIDRFNSGAGPSFTAVKDLPKGVFRSSHDPDQIYVQIQHKKRVYVLKVFRMIDLHLAVALYKETKKSIRTNNDFEITEFVRICLKQGKDASDTVPSRT